MTPARPAETTPRVGESPFDALAEGYDETFTDTLIGGLLRRAVWARADAVFQPGQRVLDLGCGTGEDALHLAGRGVAVEACDASAVMVGVARRKIADAGLAGRVRLRVLDLNDPHRGLDRLEQTPYDGALLDFGVANCVADLDDLAAGLAAISRPGAVVLLCAMGRLVPWEWGWYLAQARPGLAFRRLRRGGLRWRGVRVRYPGLGATRDAFARHFRLRRVSALGALLPPPYTERLCGAVPGLLRLLDRVERRLETLPPLPWLADHFLMELERREGRSTDGGRTRP